MARLTCAAALCGAALLAGCGGGLEDQNAIDFAPPETSFAYVAELAGAPSDEIDDLMRESLDVFRREEDGAQSLAFLRRRAEGDVETVRRILRSFGYYLGDAEIAFEALPAGDDPAEGESASEPEADSEDSPEDRPAETLVRIEVRPGPLFTLAEHVFVLGNTGEREPPEIDAAAFGSPLGAGAVAADILAAEAAAVESLQGDGRPWAEIAGRTAVADVEAHTLEVQTTIDVGPYAVYGPIVVRDLDGVDAAYIESYRTFEPGAPVDEEALRAFQRELSRTELFDAVSVRPPSEPPEGDGPVPITVAGEEAPARTVAAGARWSTDVGVSTRLRYTHRNLFRANERIDLEAELGFEEQSFEARYREPQYLRPGQLFTAGFNVRNVENDVFDEQALTLTVGLQRELDDVWTVGAGGLVEASITDDGTGDTTFTLFGLPLFVAYDDADDALNPTEGVRARLEATPFTGFADDDSDPLFTRLDGVASTYLALDEERRYVLAARGRVGVILTDGLTDVPAGKRFYSGGGGSVRGYSERAIGPRDSDGDPSGGLSVLEIGTELRARVWGPVGLAGFLEGGAVSDQMHPDFDEDPRFAAGLGVRYFSPVGPVRLDFGVPLNPADDDDAFQFYLAIGQAY